MKCAKQYGIINSHLQHLNFSDSTIFTSEHTTYLTYNRKIAIRKPASFYNCCSHDNQYGPHMWKYRIIVNGVLKTVLLILCPFFQYCLIEMDQGVRKFVMPTEKEILAHRVIVATLNTSRYLASLNLEKG